MAIFLANYKLPTGRKHDELTTVPSSFHANWNPCYIISTGILKQKYSIMSSKNL